VPIFFLAQRLRQQRGTKRCQPPPAADRAERTARLEFVVVPLYEKPDSTRLVLEQPVFERDLLDVRRTQQNRVGRQQAL
jgi:hypothetical protein